MLVIPFFITAKEWRITNIKTSALYTKQKKGLDPVYNLKKYPCVGKRVLRQPNPIYTLFITSESRQWDFKNFLRLLIISARNVIH